MENKEVAISLKNIKKSFGQVLANSNVNLEVYKGEILSLLGENGSGKTTLMNMLSGIYYPDEGQIFIDGKPADIATPKDSFKYGIGMVHQHFKLVDVLNAAENIVLGLSGKLDIKAAKDRIKEICDRYGFEIDPDEKIYNMSVSQKQTVEIVKVLYRGARILILDEPTAVLTPQETDRLFEVMRNMRADGKSIIIITHKLSEVMEISDRVAILRKGEYVGALETDKTSIQELTDMMVGRSVELNIRRSEPTDPQPRIIVEGLGAKSPDGVYRLKDVSFTANSGEVLGIAGISGCGEKELLEAIAGLYPISEGSISYIQENGEKISLAGLNPRKIREMGILLSFVPEDRLGMGLVGNMDIPDNVMLRSYSSGNSIFTDRKKPREKAEDIVEELNVATPNLSTPVRRLSGGNVQKVLVGREISSSPRVLMTAYAVRGLDINSAYAIYELINEQKEKGCAVIFVGEDLDVLLELSDRILVLSSGRVSGIVDARTTDKQTVGRMMMHIDEEQA